MQFDQKGTLAGKGFKQRELLVLGGRAPDHRLDVAKALDTTSRVKQALQFFERSGGDFVLAQPFLYIGPGEVEGILHVMVRPEAAESAIKLRANFRGQRE